MLEIVLMLIAAYYALNYASIMCVCLPLTREGEMTHILHNVIQLMTDICSLFEKVDNIHVISEFIFCVLCTVKIL